MVKIDRMEFLEMKNETSKKDHDLYGINSRLDAAE